MLRVSIYNWLPLADNMLPDISTELKTQTQFNISIDTDYAGDFIRYNAEFRSERLNTGTMSIEGQINARGFSQHSLTVPHPKEMTLAGIVEAVTPDFRTYVSHLLFRIVPSAIKNKLGVLQEGIVPFEVFESKLFDPTVDAVAKDFLRAFQTVVILVNDEYKSDIELGVFINLDNIILTYVPDKQDHFVIQCPRQRCFLFYAEQFDNDEASQFDSIIYKFSSIINYIMFMERVINILKIVRENPINPRRRTAIALQQNTEEYFDSLTRIQKYLTYVNIKLPIIQKVKNHIVTTLVSSEFKAMRDSFSTSATVSKYPLIRFIEASKQARLKPLGINSIIDDNIIRLEKLFEEDSDENNIFSSKLSEMLLVNLSSEFVRILSRELDASRSLLELDRGGKNRANALKVLSVILSANLGALIAGTLGFSGLAVLPWAALLPVLAWAFTQYSIGQKASHFRVVVPVAAKMPPETILQYLSPHDFKRSDSSGTRRTVTWNQLLLKSINSGKPIGIFRNIRQKTKKHDFDITLDYDKRGYINTITLEAEHNGVRFEKRDLIIQVLSEMNKVGCLRNYQDGEISLLAEVLRHTGVPIDEKLVSLNWILAIPGFQVEQELLAYKENPRDPSISEADRNIMQDIFDADKRDKYITWLIQAKQHPFIPIELLGHENLERKQNLLMSVFAESEAKSGALY